MTVKQNASSLMAPDGSHYVTLTDGAGNLSPASGGGGGGGLITIGDGTTSPVAVKPANTAPGATDISLVTTISPNSAGLVDLGQAVRAASVPVTIASDQGSIGALSSDYVSGATPIVATSGNVANAIAAATLAGAASKTTYISGFDLTGSGATLGSVVDVTITGLVGSITFHYEYAAIAGALLENTPLIVRFSKPIPASATNTAIVVSCPALGAGNTNNAVNVFGYQL